MVTFPVEVPDFWPSHSWLWMMTKIRLENSAVLKMAIHSSHQTQTSLRESTLSELCLQPLALLVNRQQSDTGHSSLKL